MSGCRFVVMKDRKENLDEDELELHSGDIVQIVQSGKVRRIHALLLFPLYN